jgi:hydrogenase-4 component B
MIDTKVFLSLISVFWGVGFLLPLVGKSRQAATVSLWLALLGSLFGALVSGMIWVGILPLPARLTFINLWAGFAPEFQGVSIPPLQMEFQLDKLSAFFVLLVTAFSAIVSVYSFGALNASHYERYRSRTIAAFNLFIWSTVMVIIAHDVFSLLLSLEISSLVLAYLALYKHMYYQSQPNNSVPQEKQKRARIAPQVYLALSHTSTVLLVISLIILSILAHSISFERLTFSGQYNFLLSYHLPTASFVFLLALAGLGIRAGLTPAHIWPPLVHPSAPITLHTLFTGIGIKVAIYLMYRFFFQFLEPQAGWGYSLLGLAVLTALVNVWYAISSHDLKTALAYHSVENIGIICVGIGVGLIFWKTNPFIASLGLIASLYHVLNHAVFKGLLFLATGAIDNLTHQVTEFDRLGGLIKRYGFTSAMFLIGSVSIAGFPPFNGFVSEWLTLQALLNGMIETSTPLLGLIVILLSLVLLVASFSLTAFCFYKMAGVTLLGLPRSPKSETEKWESHDVPRTMTSMMALLAGFCLLLGLTPYWMIPLLGGALKPIGVDVSILHLVSTNGFDFSFGSKLLPDNTTTPIGNLPILGMLGLALMLLAIPFFISLRHKALQPDSAWNGGTPIQEPPLHQFSSIASSFLLHDTFTIPALNRMLYKIPEYLPAHIEISPSVRSPGRVEFFSTIYNFIFDNTLRFSQAFGGWVQNRDIRRYLWYILAANLITLLIFIFIEMGK